MKIFDDEPIASCIGCGCTDDEACEPGCHWLRLDRNECAGVCSECPASVKAWDNQRVGADVRARSMKSSTA